MKKEDQNIEQYDSKEKIEIACNEYFNLRDEANSLLNSLQKVISFSLIIAGLSIPLLYNFDTQIELLFNSKNITVSGDATITQISLLIISAAYFVIAIIYIGYFRAYLTLLSYLRGVSKHIRNETGINNEIMYYDEFSRLKYNGFFSRFILIVSWGIQYILPISLGVLFMSIAQGGGNLLFEEGFVKILTYINLLLALLIIISSISLRDLFIELRVNSSTDKHQ